eukprot:jgi/Chrzof1/2394/Cz11g13150.t1
MSVPVGSGDHTQLSKSDKCELGQDNVQSSVLRRASGSGKVDVIRRSSSASSAASAGSSQTQPAGLDGHKEAPLRETVIRAHYNDGIIMKHYMGKIGSSRYLAAMDDEEAPEVIVADNLAAPPRAYVRSRHWSRGLFVCFMLGTSTYLMYALVTRILEAQAWYATPMLVVLPIGMLYFSYAAATMVNGLWNLLGKALS